MRRPLFVIAAAVLMQFAVTGTGHAVGITVDQTVEASTQRWVRVAGTEVGKITNPRVRVRFDVNPDVVGVSVREYEAGANPDDPGCTADHDLLGEGTVNMSLVADLKAGATGTREVLVEYTRTGSTGTETIEVFSSSQPMGPVDPAGEEMAVPICIGK